METLRKLLNDQVRVTVRKNLVLSKQFCEALEDATVRYSNKQITTAEMISKLLDLARSVRVGEADDAPSAQKPGQELGLSDEETAFYDALAENGLAKQVMKSDTLRLMGRERQTFGGAISDACAPCREGRCELWNGPVQEDYQDATLVLVGHGSTLNAESAAPTYQHADELRRRGIFAEVLEAFWKQEPCLAGVLRGAFTARVFVVPLFISEGYFTEEVIPRELGMALDGSKAFPITQVRGGPAGSNLESQKIYYCGPVGTHDSMTEVLLARAREVVEKHPFPRAPKARETALFIAGHGTGQNENSRKAIERQVELIRAGGDYAEVHAVFMEEEPRIGDCYEMTAAKNIVMVPFFISDGLHSYEDIPAMLGEAERIVQKRNKEGQPTWRNPTEKKGRLLWYASSVGSEPHIADVVMERVREAENWQRNPAA